MADDRVVIFDTTLRDGEQAPGFSLRVAEKLQLARQLDALGVDVIEAGFPIASRGRCRSRARDRRGSCPSGDRRAGALPPRRHRARRRVAQAGRPQPHPHVHRDVRPASRTEAAHHARAVPRGGRRRRHAGARHTPTTCSSRPRTPRAATWTSCVGSSSRLSRQAPPRSTCLTRSATPLPTRSTSSSTPSSPASPTPTRPSSARTATTTSGWPSPTRWRRCAPVRGRSSARSTASASAPATPRSKKS